jgi:hypothetical protein
MATQKMKLPSAEKARAALNRTILNIFDQNYLEQAFDPDPGGAGDDSPTLSDYTDIVVVDVTGNGDYTTLGAAFSAAPSGSLIVVFGSVTPEEYIGLSKHITLWIPNRTTINTQISLSLGAFLNIVGNGRFSSTGQTFQVNGGTLRLNPGTEILLGDLVVNNGGKIEVDGASIAYLYFSANANFTIRNTRIDDLAFAAAMTPSISRYIFSSYLGRVTCDVEWENFPMYHCILTDEPSNITVHAANFTNANITDNGNWPALPLQVVK